MERFLGGKHTEIKVSVLAQYLTAFTTALKDKGFDLIYVDAFAGTGQFAIDVGDAGLFAGVVDEAGIVSRAGSAQVAIDTQPPFAAIVLVDKHKKSIAALTELKDRLGDRRIKIVDQDANDALRKICRGVPWREGRKSNQLRAVIFLDPFGLNVEWETVVEIANTRAVDVWYLLNVEGIGRMLARKIERIPPSLKRRLNKLFGGDGWQTEFYKEVASQPRLDGEIDRKTARVTSAEHIETAYIERMKEHFGYVHPKALRLFKGGRHSFSLIFAVANQSQPAISAAQKMASWIIDNGGRSKQPVSKKLSDNSDQGEMF